MLTYWKVETRYRLSRSEVDHRWQLRNSVYISSCIEAIGDWVLCWPTPTDCNSQFGSLDHYFPIRVYSNYGSISLRFADTWLWECDRLPLCRLWYLGTTCKYSKSGVRFADPCFLLLLHSVHLYCL